MDLPGDVKLEPAGLLVAGHAGSNRCEGFKASLFTDVASLREDTQRDGSIVEPLYKGHS